MSQVPNKSVVEQLMELLDVSWDDIPEAYHDYLRHVDAVTNAE